MSSSLVADTPPQVPSPLRAREAFLDGLIAEVLRSHATAGTYDVVQSLRALTQRRRRDPASPVHDELMALVESLPLPVAVEVVRACSLYFQLANLAEHLHRERRRRERAGGPPPRSRAMSRYRTRSKRWSCRTTSHAPIRFWQRWT